MSKSRSGAVGLAALLAVSLSGATLAQDEAVEISYLTHWGPDQVAQLEAVVAAATIATVAQTAIPPSIS